MYAELVDNELGLAEGASAASLRSANMLFMHACRTKQVPHTTPGHALQRLSNALASKVGTT